MTHWTSKIIVFKGQDGQDFVSTALPTGTVFEQSQIQVFQASGPYMPLGFPAAKPVGDAAVWMDGLRQKGFSFEPSSLD